MEVAAVHRLVDAIVAVDDATERDVLTDAVAQVSRLLTWCQGQQMRLTRLLAQVAAFPEQALAGPAKIALPAAAKLLERANTAEAAPQLAAAVGDGLVSGEHVDALTRTVRSVQPELRGMLFAQADTLVDVAASSTPEEFARRLRHEVRRLESDDGEARFERQRRATRLRTWTDRETGMWCLSGRFDPMTGATFSRALDNALAGLFADATPNTCPADPIEKQDHLRALALVSLVQGTGSGPGRPEVIVVVDARDPDPVAGGPIIDWGIPVDVPARVLADLAQRADVHTVVTRNGVVIHAPGELNLGRSTRLANRAQRRALRGLYSRCAIPGCAARFDNCKIHHVLEWEAGGRTDLCNLVPICAHHHARLHADAWQLTLGPDRTLTINLPDGTILATGPPRRGAA